MWRSVVFHMVLLGVCVCGHAQHTVASGYPESPHGEQGIVERRNANRKERRWKESVISLNCKSDSGLC